MSTNPTPASRPVVIYTQLLLETLANSEVRWTIDGATGDDIAAIVESDTSGVCLDITRSVVPGADRDAVAFAAMNGLAAHLKTDTISNVAVTTYMDPNQAIPPTEQLAALENKSLDSLVAATGNAVRGFVQRIAPYLNDTRSSDTATGEGYVVIAPKIEGITPGHAIVRAISMDDDDRPNPLVVSYVQSKTFDTDTAILQRLNATAVEQPLIIIVTPDDVDEWNATFGRLVRRHAKTLFSRKWYTVSYPTATEYLAARAATAS